MEKMFRDRPNRISALSIFCRGSSSWSTEKVSFVIVFMFVVFVVFVCVLLRELPKITSAIWHWALQARSPAHTHTNTQILDCDKYAEPNNSCECLRIMFNINRAITFAYRNRMLGVIRVYVSLAPNGIMESENKLAIHFRKTFRFRMFFPVKTDQRTVHTDIHSFEINNLLYSLQLISIAGTIVCVCTVRQDDA